MGEMGLFYRLTGLVFVGKSIGGAQGGQNPIEPAKLGSAVVHGPATANFREVYEALDTAGGAVLARDGAALAREIAGLLDDPARGRRVARAGADVVEKLAGATNRTMAELKPYLERLTAAAP